MEEKEMTFKVLNDEGVEVECDIIENILERLQTEEGISDLLDESNLTTEMRDYFMDGMK